VERADMSVDAMPVAGATASAVSGVAPMLRAFVRDIGTLGIVGVVLLLAAGPAWWVLVHLPHQQAAEIKSDLARQRARRFSAAERPAVAPAAQQIERFRTVFPDASTTPAALAQISRLAAASKVTLASGDYRLAEERALGMQRYEVRYPVKGAWRDVFTLLAALLNEMPTLALDEVVFKRESRNAAEVDAQLRFSLFFTDATVEPGSRTRASAGAVVPAAAATAPPAGSAAPPARRGGNDG